MGDNLRTSNTTQAAWIGIGSLCTFGFSLVSAAILSRFLTKEDYGTYKQVMYVYNTLLAVFTLGLPRAYAYFLPRVKITEGNSLINKLNRCFFILGFIFSVFLYLCANNIADILKNENLALVIKIFSPTPLFLLPTMGLEGIFATYRKSHWNAIYVIITRVLMLFFVAMPVAFYRADTIMAVWGFTLSSFVSCIIALYLKKQPFRKVIHTKTEVSFKQIFSFSLPLMFAGFWGIAEKSADQFFVSRFFGQNVFADFANGSLELPFVGMVLSAGSTVLLPIFSKMVSENDKSADLLDLWRRTAIKSAYIIYPLVIFSWFFADVIMTFLYGDNYTDSAIFFRIMILINFFTVAQYYPIVLALGKTKYYSNVHLWCAIAVWILEYIAVLIFNSPYVVTIVSVLCRLVKILLMMNLIAGCLNVSIVQLFPIATLSKIATCCVIASGAVYYLVVSSAFINAKLIVLILGFLLYMVIILILGKIIHIDFLIMIKPYINKILAKR